MLVLKQVIFTHKVIAFCIFWQKFLTPEFVDIIYFYIQTKNKTIGKQKKLHNFLYVEFINLCNSEYFQVTSFAKLYESNYICDTHETHLICNVICLVLAYWYRWNDLWYLRNSRFQICNIDILYFDISFGLSKKIFLIIIDKWSNKVVLYSSFLLRHLITTFVSKCVNNVWTWRSTIFVIDLLNIKGNMRGKRVRGEREVEIVSANLHNSHYYRWS